MRQTKNLKTEIRPWGQFFIIQESENYKIKRIEILPNHRLSYQYHQKRSEVWVIIKGHGKITIDGKVQDYKIGDTIRIPKYAKHRIQSGNTETVFIEIQTGEYFGEDDIVRIEDDYNRLNEK
tara:strand:+ start:7201 stop:7566 length:366 start_codon:yes stop_codon:yes gene_type:complete